MCITNRWTPAGRTAYAANMKACLQEESVIQVSCKSLMWCLYNTTRDAAELFHILILKGGKIWHPPSLQIILNASQVLCSFSALCKQFGQKIVSQFCFSLTNCSNSNVTGIKTSMLLFSIRKLCLQLILNRDSMCDRLDLELFCYIWSFLQLERDKAPLLLK